MSDYGNIFSELPAGILQDESFTELFADGHLRIERIVSTGQQSPEGFWYDQTENEWLILLQGKATLEYCDGTINELSQGDYCMIPAHRKHRVSHTSANPCCVWLALFWKPQVV
jgi:cupin 2 domain-containing protein